MKEPKSAMEGTQAAQAGVEWTREATNFWSRMMSNAGPNGASPELLERIRTLSQQTMSFVEDRVRKDMEAARALTEAKSPADVARIQMDFFQSLVGDYNRQAMRVAEEAGKAMTAAFLRMPGMPRMSGGGGEEHGRRGAAAE